MKAAWERVVEKNTTKTVYKTKEQREWEAIERASELLEKYMNVGYYNRIDKNKQNQMRAKVARLTKMCGNFWEKVGCKVLDS